MINDWFHIIWITLGSECLKQLKSQCFNSLPSSTVRCWPIRWARSVASEAANFKQLGIFSAKFCQAFNMIIKTTTENWGPPACASLAGFQHRSKWITWLAVVRFKPTPPACQGGFHEICTVFCLLFQPSPAFKVRIKTRHFGSEEKSFKASRTWSHGTKPPWS